MEAPVESPGALDVARVLELIIEPYENHYCALGFRVRVRVLGLRLEG